ncbi:MAG: hypothetical protein JWM35_923, partial [Verrucomicrobia bacterium]|nr:hypothetical protein [Verrucomicrobiota bacterium]
DFVRGKTSLLAKYTWTAGPLKGVMFGAGMESQGEKRNGSGLIDTPTTYALFSSYHWGSHWSTQLNVDNLTNERYIVAVAAPGMVQVGDPLTIRLAIGYKW